MCVISMNTIKLDFINVRVEFWKQNKNVLLKYRFCTHKLAVGFKNVTNITVLEYFISTNVKTNAISNVLRYMLYSHGEISLPEQLYSVWKKVKKQSNGIVFLRHFIQTQNDVEQSQIHNFYTVDIVRKSDDVQKTKKM